MEEEELASYDEPLTKYAFKLSTSATTEHTRNLDPIAKRHPNMTKGGKRKTQNPKGYTFLITILTELYFQNMKKLVWVDITMIFNMQIVG